MSNLKIIGKWNIIGPIDRGGQAQVYEASAGEGQPNCALKAIKSIHPKKRTRFIQEILKHVELTEKKAHNIIPIIDHNLKDFEQGVPLGYIVMPKAETNLDKEINILVGRLEICLEIFRGIIDGVIEAHAIGLIHRDLKPANILFLDKTLHTPLLTDFGICFVKYTPDEERITEVNETVGAKFFMAPEQERGGITEVRESADIYALGKLLHYMITKRHLYRENVHEAFEISEIDKDPRLKVILEKILVRTIDLEQDKRIQTAIELRDVVDQIMKDFGIKTSSSGNNSTSTNLQSTHINSQSGEIFKTYNEIIGNLDQKRISIIKISFDQCFLSFKKAWEVLYLTIKDKPEQAREAATMLIADKPESVGLTMAITRLDVVELFPDFKRLLERLTKLSANQSGYDAVIGVPHVPAAFLYMCASIAALIFESWGILALLLNQKFEWYYQSGRPLYSFGFDHPYFFHSYVFDRYAPKTHDEFRNLLKNPEILEIFGVDEDEILNIYNQIQMIMCLRCAQEQDVGDGRGMWPDFGRFYGERIVSLLDKAHHNQNFAEGLCKAFNETPDEWFNKFNERLIIVRSWFKGSSYFWDSITSYEPR